MIKSILVIILSTSLLAMSSTMNFLNNDDNNDDDDGADYYDDDDDVWLVNEYKAKLHNRLNNNKEFSSIDSLFYDNDNDDYYNDNNDYGPDDIKDIRSRNLIHTCREIASGPHRLERAGYDIRPPHYHNISCVEFTGNSLQHGPMVLQCEAKRTGHRQRCTTAIRQINVFRRLKSSRDSCWKQDTMWIENGCNCKS